METSHETSHETSDGDDDGMAMMRTPRVLLEPGKTTTLDLILNRGESRLAN